jgi:hypothetical protein
LSQTPAAGPSTEGQTTQVSEENKAPGFEFELHYGLSTTVEGLLWEILDDISSYKPIHNWDEKLGTSPLKALRKIGGKSWRENRCSLSHLQADSIVDEILTLSEADQSAPATQKTADIEKFLFFTKVGSVSCDCL